jgi:hypothetical protein
VHANSLGCGKGEKLKRGKNLFPRGKKAPLDLNQAKIHLKRGTLHMKPFAPHTKRKKKSLLLPAKGMERKKIRPLLLTDCLFLPATPKASGESPISPKDLPGTFRETPESFGEAYESFCDSYATFGESYEGFALS